MDYDQRWLGLDPVQALERVPDSRWTAGGAVGPDMCGVAVNSSVILLSVPLSPGTVTRSDDQMMRIPGSFLTRTMSSAPFVQQHLRLADSGRSYSPGSFAPLLKKLVLTPSTFSLPDVSLAMEHLATEGGAGEAQIGAFLTALRLSGQDVDAAVVAACATVMRHHSLPLAPPALSDAEAGPICDIVGTGGDGQNTFNVSTTAGIVAAGAGCRVYKHGNKAATSSSGSADILISLECPVMSIPSSAFETITKSSNFLFLYAPNYHPAMKILAPIRKSLPFPTVFNILGPLINPARPSAMIVGVHSPGLGRIFIQAMKVLGVKRAWVVCGREGLDEISPDGETDVCA